LDHEPRAPQAAVRRSGPIAARSAVRAPNSSSGGPRRAVLQAKLVVGPADDPFEREADAMAALAVRTLGSISASSSHTAKDDTDDAAGFGRIRRSSRASTGSVVAPVAAVGRIRRATYGATIGRAGGDLDAETTQLLRSSRSGGTPLPDEPRSRMEAVFGADFGAVRVHAGPTSTELNGRIQARAFTVGSDIYFRDSVPDASSSSGQALLAHELTHTIQQGAARPTRTVSRQVNDNHIQRVLDAPAQVTPLDQTKAEFMSRIARLENEIPRLKGQNIAATGEALWTAYSGTISGQRGMSSADGEVRLNSVGLNNKVPETSPGMRNNRATNPQTYNQDPEPAAAPGESLARGSYVTNMSESFNLLTTALKGLSQLQFDKYKTFAFWNSPGAKDVAVAAKSSGVLALESSAIGGLFDGFGSYDELAGGVESTSWDPQLWAELSRAYASMVIDAIVKDRSKRIVVMCGIGFNDPSFNIWNSIESLTLKLGAKRAKMLESDLQAKTKYFGVAGHMDGGKPVVNMASTYEGIAGTWVSCDTPAEMVKWQAAQIKSNSQK
jgi:Domain of unknown function (DUF4157)